MSQSQIKRNREYNEARRVMNDWAKRDFEREKMLEQVYQQSINRITRQIDDFYLRYAGRNGLTRLEANQIIRHFNVPAWANKAAEAVKNKDFSPETNKWLSTYNTKMYISRAELLKAELQLELQQLYANEHALIDKHLTEEAIAELKRQAGIMGNSATGSADRARRIVDGDFYGKHYSQRVWGQHYKEANRALFGALNEFYTDMTGYQNVRRKLMNQFDVSEAQAMRLLRTETSRIRADAQRESYTSNEFTHYRYCAEPGACRICADLDGVVFPVEDMEIGYNMYPMHPNCRCNTYGIIKMERKDGTSNLDEFEVRESKSGGLDLNLQMFARSDKKEIQEKVTIGEIDEKLFFKRKREFDNIFKNGLKTPIETIFNKKDSYYHIINRHPEDFFNDTGVEDIRKTLVSPEEIYETKDMFGNTGTSYIGEIDGEKLMVVTRNDIITAYKPNKKYYTKIRNQGVKLYGD